MLPSLPCFFYILEVGSTNYLVYRTGGKTMTKAVVFTAGGEEFAFPIEAVQSIEKPSALSAIAGAPEYVKGMAEIRGTLLPLIDAKAILYPGKSPADSKTEKWILIEGGQRRAGIVVEDAKEIIELNGAKIQQIGSLGIGSSLFFEGVASCGDRLITIVDAGKMLASLEGMEDWQRGDLLEQI